ncbi:MAG: hypothetical protein KDD05_01990 [Psychroserpens sp.]|nr:hypothetical protein [Psychroserpens sp.]
MFLDLSSQFYAVILGGLLMLSFYHLLIYTQNAKKLYLYYGLYALSFSIYLIERLPDDPLNLHYINPAIQFVTFALYVLFTRSLLETKTQSLVLDNFLRISKNVLLLLALFFLIIHIIYPHEVQFKIYFYVVPVFILLCVFIYGLIFKLKGSSVKYFLLGSLLYFGLSIVSFISTPTSGIISEAWIYKKGMHPLFPMYIGVIIENLIFAILVGNKAKEIEIKKITAEKDYIIERQKTTNLLKQQELTAIDAMIEGQEKERQRIANDLHDDLGGLMANVKLHFNALKEQKSTELFDRTNLLIDEAYQKIRTIAHAKNSGVIAKQGLLKAIHHMADKISASNQINIDVLDHGLENRLENSLELTIFRIIQELVTNVIKHAEASEVSIHITNHDDCLNIMVEDNGIGFNTSQITKSKNGMGIKSIDKRVEHLNGNMTIESERHQGTTIIIDIPI